MEVWSLEQGFCTEKQETEKRQSYAPHKLFKHCFKAALDSNMKRVQRIPIPGVSALPAPTLTTDTNKINVVIPRFSKTQVKKEKDVSFSLDSTKSSFSISPSSAFTPFMKNNTKMGIDKQERRNSLESELEGYMNNATHAQTAYRVRNMNDNDIISPPPIHENSNNHDRMRPSNPVGRTLALLSRLECQCREVQRCAEMNFRSFPPQ